MESLLQIAAGNKRMGNKRNELGTLLRIVEVHAVLFFDDKGTIIMSTRFSTTIIAFYTDLSQ